VFYILVQLYIRLYKLVDFIYLIIFSLLSGSRSTKCFVENVRFNLKIESDVSVDLAVADNVFDCENFTTCGA